MALSAGTRFGPYEILTPLGAGGMGEVYRARDTRLDRTVAIKILPEALAADPQFRDRFDREARTISQLDHPHICALFDVGEHGGTSYLVMPYLEGVTLAERLLKGPVPVTESLTIAVQIAEALDTAHRAGIVHRDLKPGNIMLTKGGVKLLDFGLAKAGGPAIAGMGPSMAPTTPPNLTVPGSILGTFQYMAPEQIEGEEADARTDVFAFGVVLYEMVAGKKAFAGKTQASVLGAILKEEPPPLSTIEPLTPLLVDHIVRRCLAKDPEERWQTTGDLMRELKWVAAEGSELATSISVTPVASVALRRQVRVAWTLLGLAALVIVALSIPVVRYLREQPVDPLEMRFEIPTPFTTQPLHFALSPDGTRLVFVASGDGVPRLWLRALDSLVARPLADTEGAEYPFWSPDSRSIGFFAGSKLKRLDIAGGVPQILADAATGRGGAWNPEGTIVFAPTNASPLWRIPASGGEAVPVTTLKLPQQSHRLPQFLPDGRHFLFFVQGSPDVQGIYLGALDGSATKRLTPADAAGAYAEPGALVFLRQDGLIARQLNVAAGTMEGDAVTIADRVDSDISFDLGGFSVSKARLAYRTGGLERRQLTWFDRGGKRLGTAGDADANGLLSPQLSSDGRLVAVQRTVQSNMDVWVIDPIRGGATRLTFDASPDQTPVWSPDGSLVAFSSLRKGAYDLYVKPSTGGTEQLLLESASPKIPTDWSRDGRLVLYQYADPKTGWDLAALPIAGNDRTPIVVANTAFEERAGQFSPDARWVAYQSNVTGRFEIYVQPFPGPGRQWPVSTAGGTDPRWRADGKELFFIGLDGKLMAAPVGMSGSTFEAGAPAALFQTRMAVGGAANLKQQYAVSRDGRFLVNVPFETSTAPITLILNWHPPFKP
jgi:serine/threonine protein kinase/Tol biopolymer transport system component